MKKCQFSGCDSPYLAKGFCSGHYNQMKRWGIDKMRPLFLTKRGMAKKNPELIPHGTACAYTNYACRCDICSIYYSEQRKNAREERTTIINEYKLDQGCADCGYDKYACVLDFDHLSDKSFTISRELMNVSLERIFEEIAKCDVVCSNCHRIRTALRTGNLR